MTLAKINDISIHYQLEGDKDAPVLMLCNSLSTTLEMWEPQMATLLTQFQVLRYDGSIFGVRFQLTELVGRDS